MSKVKVHEFVNDPLRPTAFQIANKQASKDLELLFSVAGIKKNKENKSGKD